MRFYTKFWTWTTKTKQNEPVYLNWLAITHTNQSFKRLKKIDGSEMMVEQLKLNQQKREEPEKQIELIHKLQSEAEKPPPPMYELQLVMLLENFRFQNTKNLDIGCQHYFKKCNAAIPHMFILMVRMKSSLTFSVYVYMQATNPYTWKRILVWQKKGRMRITYSLYASPGITCTFFWKKLIEFLN